jgi:hypothetical protein
MILIFVHALQDVFLSKMKRYLENDISSPFVRDDDIVGGIEGKQESHYSSKI